MPYKSKRPCIVPGCRNFVKSNNRCATHLKEHQNNRNQCGFYNREVWDRIRNNQLRQYPFCKECGTQADLEVDHIEAHNGEWMRFIDQDNLQTLCKSCHSRKTRRKN